MKRLATWPPPLMQTQQCPKIVLMQAQERTQRYPCEALTLEPSLPTTGYRVWSTQRSFWHQSPDSWSNLFASHTKDAVSTILGKRPKS